MLGLAAEKIGMLPNHMIMIAVNQVMLPVQTRQNALYLLMVLGKGKIAQVVHRIFRRNVSFHVRIKNSSICSTLSNGRNCGQNLAMFLCEKCRSDVK